MAIHRTAGDPKGRHTGRKVAKVEYGGHGTVALLAVYVDDDANVVDLVVAHRRETFPCLTFLEFAVRHIDPHLAGLFVPQPRGATPDAMESPCASEPVVTSMPGLCSAPIISTEPPSLLK